MLDILLVSATAKEHKDSEIHGVPIHQVGIGKVEARVDLADKTFHYKRGSMIGCECGL